MDTSLKRFHLLVEAALSGQLTQLEHEELEQLLRESQELRSRYLQIMHTQIDLDTVSQRFPPPDDQVTPVRQPVRTKPKAVRWFTAGVVAVVGMLTLWMSWARFASQPEQIAVSPSDNTLSPPGPTAIDLSPVIAETAGAKLFGEGFDPVPGERLVFEKKYVLTQGYLALKFASGARAVLKAPAVFTPLEPEKLQVRSGQCSVHAPPGAEGFQVISPTAEVVDLGTRFVVDVAETGETELLVIDGAATMAATSADSSPPRLFQQGESGRVEPGLALQPSAQQLEPRSFLDLLPDRVVRYTATRNPEGYADELLSVTVQRGGKIVEYPRDQLQRARLVHFTNRANTVTFCTRKGESLPDGKDRLGLLDNDWSLVTGIINPQVSSKNRDQSTLVTMAVEFEHPVINLPGPDIVLFDLHLLVGLPGGDRVTLRSGDPGGPRTLLRVSQYDLDLMSPYALNLLPHMTYRAVAPTESVEGLVNGDFLHGRQVNIDAKAIALGIDLTDLGYPEGASLQRLEFLDTSPSQKVDPVLIVGLPPSAKKSPEPGKALDH
ncbi:hypothetical protein [Planctomicrobium sp. SH664]|uniref:hypothetical protein n=1 Tax=Planctomicrobium sp. SH664 TaxID=3448125 RepID=UPI003F5C0738